MLTDRQARQSTHANFYRCSLLSPSRRPRGTLCPQKLALTSPTRGGRSFGIVRLRTQAMEFSLVRCCHSWKLVPRKVTETLAQSFYRTCMSLMIKNDVIVVVVDDTTDGEPAG
jgi:hypothetical protein